MVEVNLSRYILNSIKEESPHVIILTGHAGDGKTSIMYQVLSELEVSFDISSKVCDYTLSSGRKLRCIKDFSEIADENKKQVLAEAFHMTNNGGFVFIVANTGPLINTFGELFEDEHKREMAKIQLIDQMDSNTGSIVEIEGYKLCVINVATVDNTYFATKFIKKLIQDKLWKECEQCPKNCYCHILSNRNLIFKNITKVCEFSNMHYVWITEHGKRLTIRSMTEQLAYMITGGFNCDEVEIKEKYKYLFCNLFFGYVGTILNPKASNILAVKEANNCQYDKKRMRFDEKLIINKDFNNIFGKDMEDIISDAEINNYYINGWDEFLRRAYFFTNIITDDEMIEESYEDIFSKQYKRYLALRNGDTTPSRTDSILVCDALSMIYVGTTNDNLVIPITLSRESGITQNVQLITGALMSKKVHIIQVPTKKSLFDETSQRRNLKLKINNQVLDSEITLPLLNYFEELKNGIISTNVDPQLSHGIESLKAELTKLIDDDDSFEMIILKNSGPQIVRLEITNKGKITEL